jgi:hypothetical protein
MRAEAREEANAVLDRHAERSSSITGIMPHCDAVAINPRDEIFPLSQSQEAPKWFYPTL